MLSESYFIFILVLLFCFVLLLWLYLSNLFKQFFKNLFIDTLSIHSSLFGRFRFLSSF